MIDLLRHMAIGAGLLAIFFGLFVWLRWAKIESDRNSTGWRIWLVILVVAFVTFSITWSFMAVQTGNGLPYNTRIIHTILPEIESIPNPTENDLKWDGTQLFVKLDPNFFTEVVVNGVKKGPFAKGSDLKPIPMTEPGPKRVQIYRYEESRSGRFREWLLP